MHEPGYDPHMCLICVELAKEKLTTSEARRALGEMRMKLDREHIAEVEAKLAEAEQREATKP
jgi:hypothetical protein